MPWAQSELPDNENELELRLAFANRKLSKLRASEAKLKLARNKELAAKIADHKRRKAKLDDRARIFARLDQICVQHRLDTREKAVAFFSKRYPFLKSLQLAEPAPKRPQDPLILAVEIRNKAVRRSIAISKKADKEVRRLLDASKSRS